jgi:hypothetical protein
MKQLKKLAKLLLIVLVVAYVLRKPGPAAATLRVAGQTAYQGVLSLADSAAKFLDALFRH